MDEMMTPGSTPDHVKAAIPAVHETGVFVISLKRAAERRASFAARASQTDVSWTFFDACETLSPSLQYRERDALIHVGRVLHGRELGCYSSHYAVWEEIARSGVRQALVLEDDVHIDWNFVAMLLATDLASEGIHYLKLYNMRAVPFHIVREKFLHRSLIRFSGFAYGMQAYVLTAEGAARLVEKMKVVRRPIDDEIDRDWAHGLPNLAVFPFPAFESIGPSTIGDERYAYAPIPRDLAVPRFLARVRERLCRTFLSSPRRKI